MRGLPLFSAVGTLEVRREPQTLKPLVYLVSEGAAATEGVAGVGVATTEVTINEDEERDVVVTVSNRLGVTELHQISRVRWRQWTRSCSVLTAAVQHLMVAPLHTCMRDCSECVSL